jgi:type II secretory pathway pseudopilin PulG
VAIAASRSAFTLVEVLLTVLAVGLLVALLAPSLLGAREAGRRSATLSLCKSHAAVFQVYATDYRDTWPFLNDPRLTTTRHEPRPGLVRDVPYFQQYLYWPVAMSAGYYNGSLASSLFDAPAAPAAERRSSIAVTSSFEYPCVFVAHASYWAPETRLAGNAQWSPTTVSDVTFPSDKALLVSRWPLAEDARFTDGSGYDAPRPPLHLLAFTDGHGEQLPPDRRGLEYPTGDGPNADAGAHGIAFPRLLHTLHGVRGRDRR